MAYMTEVQQPEQVVSFQDAPSAPHAMSSAPEMQFCIKRVGARPLEFTGVELAMAMSYHPEMPWWYEFNLFRGGEGFVVTVKRFHVSEDETDYCRAWEFGDLESAMAALEGYDAAQDVKADRYMVGPDASAAELAAAAMGLRAEIAETRAHYASLVGEFLHDLDEAA